MLFLLQVSRLTKASWRPDGQFVALHDDDHVLLSTTESFSLNAEVYELEYLYLNDDKLLWTNDLELLKNFVENVLKQQGKWLTPGGNTKQFKSSNGSVIINWYNKKQQTLSFQGRDGPSLRDKLVDLVQKKSGKTTDFQDPDPLVSTEQTTQPSLLREDNSSQEHHSRSTTRD